jgi:hypothetical protein
MNDTPDGRILLERDAPDAEIAAVQQVADRVGIDVDASLERKSADPLLLGAALWLITKPLRSYLKGFWRALNTDAENLGRSNYETLKSWFADLFRARPTLEYITHKAGEITIIHTPELPIQAYEQLAEIDPEVLAPVSGQISWNADLGAWEGVWPEDRQGNS